MIKLHQQVEKQQQIKRGIKRVKSWLTIVLIILGITLCFTLLLRTKMQMLTCVSTVFVVSLIIYFIRWCQLGNSTKQIIRSIERILESTLESHISDNSLAFVDCYRHDDNYLSFSIEVYDDVISYDTLVSLTEQLARDINDIIHENLVALYRIERSEEIQFE